MNAIANITGPIFLIIAAGYLSVRLGLFAKADMRILARFVMFIALPALLFDALASRNLRDIVHTDYLVVYALGALLTLLAMYAWQRRCNASFARAGTMAMGAACANSGFVGFPALLLVLPQVAPVVLALNMVVENFLLLPLAMAASERQDGQRAHWAQALWQTIKPLRTNPLFIAIVAGAALALTGWTLPQAVSRSVQVMAQAAGATALFAIGGGLVGLQLKGLLRPVAQIAAAKLLLHPALTALLAYGVWPLRDASLQAAVVLSAAMPMLGVYPLLAGRVAQDELASASLLVTTVAAFFSLSVALTLVPLPR